MELIADGSTITLKVDGVQLWSGTDTNALTNGTVAVYSWWNNGAQYDNVLVRNLSVPLANTAPRRPPQPWPEREPHKLVMLPRRSALEADAPWSLLRAPKYLITRALILLLAPLGAGGALAERTTLLYT